MNCQKIKKLHLEEAGKIGFTYKCLGAGFWALKQSNFQKAMIKLIMEVIWFFSLTICIKFLNFKIIHNKIWCIFIHRMLSHNQRTTDLFHCESSHIVMAGSSRKKGRELSDKLEDIQEMVGKSPNKDGEMWKKSQENLE